MEMIRLRTFGGIGVIDAADRPIASLDAQRRLLGLLILLAAAGGRGLTRDKLLAMLWPDAESERARHSLTQALYSTRRATGVDDLFETSGSIRLNADRITVDLTEFEHAISESDHLQAVELYAGTFLDGFGLPGSREFADWVSERRATYEEDAFGALGQLAERAESDGEYARAISWRRRHVRIRPLDTAAIGKLAVSLSHVGDRAGIARLAAEHEEALRHRVGLQPDPAFHALIARLCHADTSSVGASARVPARRDPTVESNRITLAVGTVAPPPTPSGETLGRLRQRFRQSAVVLGFRPGLHRAWALIGLLAIVAGGLYQLGNAARGSGEIQAAPMSTRVAIAPFSVVGADASIQHLGVGLPELLAFRLADDSTNRVLESARVFSRWKTHGLDRTLGINPDALVQIGREIGVSKILIGRLVGTRAHTVAAVSVFSVSSRKVVASAELEAPSDSVGWFSEELGLRLLIAEAGDRELERAPHPSTIVATRAYLGARAAFRRGEYAAAVRLFDGTLSADTAFAPALVDLAVAAQHLGDVERVREAVARVWHQRGKLDPQRLGQLVAIAGPTYPQPSRAADQLAAWEALARREPRRPEPWAFLARRLLQDGARLGYDGHLPQAMSAATRAIAIAPDDIATRTILAQLAATDQSPSKDRTADFRTLASADPSPLVQWIDATLRRNHSALEGLRGEFSRASRTTLRTIALYSQDEAAGLTDGLAALEALRARAITLRDKVDIVLAEHSLALNRGDRVAALLATTRLRRLRPDSHADLRLRVLDAIYGDGDQQPAVAAVTELARAIDSSFLDFPLRQPQAAADACVIAQWKLTHADTVGVRTTISRLRGVGSPVELPIASTTPLVCVELLDAALAVETDRTIAKALVDRVDSMIVTPVVAGNAATYAHLLIARLYERLGDDSDALRAVRKHSYMAGWAPYAAATWRAEARLAESVGDRAAARRAAARYQRYRSVPAG